MRRSLWAWAVAVGAWPFTVTPPAFATPAPAAASATLAPAARSGADTTPEIDGHDALVHVKALAAPEMEGRGALTPGLGRAADYIAGRFSAMGLAGAGDAGSFFEEVDLPLPRRPGSRTALRLGGRALEIGRDFAPNLGAAATRGQAGIVFAGYGISVTGGYDDYADVDARGKLVICLRYAPRYDVASGHAADSRFDAGAALRAKIENAIRHGAIGVAIVDPPPAATAGPGEAPGLAAEPGHGQVPAMAPGEISSLAVGSVSGAGNIASFHLARAAAAQLLGGADADGLASLQRRIDDSGRPASFPAAASADFTVEWETPSIPGRNVVALLAGSDPVLRREAVLIGAHYDHLGRGDEGSALGPSGQVHPGADDNASGTAAVLEVAEALSAARVRPRRSLLFVAFTGEEKGLIGSLALAAQAGGRQVVAMLNLDMVGRMRAGALEVGGAPTAPEWEAIANAANQERLVLSFPKRVVPNSDHAAFLGQQIPSLFLFTGLHADYHRASDTWDKINAEGIAQTARLAQRILVAVADRDQRLAFVAPQWTRSGAVGGTHGITVRLGVMPDYQSTTGLRVSAVLDGGAGAEAGLKAGDVIDRIGEKPVTDIDSYMEALAVFKVGQQTVVTVRRDGVSRELNVKFGAASSESPPAPGGAHP
jgi:Zn-dependent M28 family amino/carboxypeptidase